MSGSVTIITTKGKETIGIVNATYVLGPNDTVARISFPPNERSVSPLQEVISREKLFGGKIPKNDGTTDEYIVHGH